jgi:DNA-directed RNA polymerase subunit F
MTELEGLSSDQIIEEIMKEPKKAEEVVLGLIKALPELKKEVKHRYRFSQL